MLDRTDQTTFAPLNAGYGRTFHPQRISLGLVVPIESYMNGPVPTMTRHIERVRLAENVGFSAVWLRDVPFNVPAFGDAGQTFDPFVYLGYLAAQTTTITLGVASLVLPLRHPAHVAKAAATVDQLSGGRLVLGVASGDRPDEYPAMMMDYESRGERFRDSIKYIRAMAGHFPHYQSKAGYIGGQMDMLPKPHGKALPLLITGGSQQHPEWGATHTDGWMTYPRPLPAQARAVKDYRTRLKRLGQSDKPVMQPLYVDLLDEPDAPPQPLHLGFRVGMNGLKDYLKSLEMIGVNHVALNLRFNRADIEDTLKKLAEELLPEFSAKKEHGS